MVGKVFCSWDFDFHCHDYQLYDMYFDNKIIISKKLKKLKKALLFKILNKPCTNKKSTLIWHPENSHVTTLGQQNCQSRMRDTCTYKVIPNMSPKLHDKCNCEAFYKMWCIIIFFTFQSLSHGAVKIISGTIIEVVHEIIDWFHTQDLNQFDLP